MELEVVPTLPDWAAEAWRAGDFARGAGEDANGLPVVNIYLSTARGPVWAAELDATTLGATRGDDPTLAVRAARGLRPSKIFSPPRQRRIFPWATQPHAAS